MYSIRTEDFYKDITPHVCDTFDTSNYSKDHPSDIEKGVNKKVIGKFKDEAGGKQITEFVGLRPKLYSYQIDGADIKKCKGVKASVINKRITFDDYKNCLMANWKDNAIVYRSMRVFWSRKHTIYTEKINKVALSADDDKRVIMGNGIDTLAYGHKDL